MVTVVAGVAFVVFVVLMTPDVVVLMTTVVLVEVFITGVTVTFPEVFMVLFPAEETTAAGAEVVVAFTVVVFAGDATMVVLLWATADDTVVFCVCSVAS